MIKRFLLVVPLIVFILIIIIFYYFLYIKPHLPDIPSALINKKIPQFVSKSLFENNTFNSSHDLKNEIYLINFFASWCIPCKLEHQYLHQLSENEKIRIIGINYKDDSKLATEWLKSVGNPYYKVVSDQDGLIAINFGVYWIPETFIINQNSNIVYRHAGPITDEGYGFLLKKMFKVLK